MLLLLATCAQAVSLGRSLGAPSHAGCTDSGLFGGALGSSMQLVVLLLALWALLSQAHCCCCAAALLYRRRSGTPPPLPP